MISDRSVIATRFGYGLPTAKGAAGSVAEVLALLSGPDLMAERWPIAGTAAVAAQMAARRASRQLEGPAEVIDPIKQQAQQVFNDSFQIGQRHTFARAIDAVDGFRERLVSFWANHFTTVGRAVTDVQLPLAMVEDAIRPHLTGSFADLLSAATLHPAMLVYLDQVASVGPGSRRGLKRGTGLNENLARELLELHTLGVAAPYSQSDVTELAKLLTGAMFTPKRGMFFDPSRAEPGAEQVLGKSYDGKGREPIDALLRDLAARPETALHIARKLAVHFVADVPEQALVDAIAAAYRDSGGDLMACYAALLGHPSAFQPRLRKARQPFDFVVAAARALGIGGVALGAMDPKLFGRSFPGAMGLMGQPFKKPSGPNGFPEAAENWISPSGLAQRISWALQRPKMLLRDLPEPLALARAGLAEWASPTLMSSVARAEDRVQGVALVLASGEFNRR